MRIVAGSVRGRTIETVPGADIRPTMDRVREAVFNSLHSHGLVEDLRFVDLFAGSGALGLEALSRGASHCTFIDSSRAAIRAIQANVESLDFADRARVRAGDALTIVAGGLPCDVALLDPPYGFDEWAALLAGLDCQAIVVESDRSIDLGPGWQILKSKRYAGTVVEIAERLPLGADGSDVAV